MLFLVAGSYNSVNEAKEPERIDDGEKWEYEYKPISQKGENAPYPNNQGMSQADYDQYELQEYREEYQ